MRGRQLWQHRRLTQMCFAVSQPFPSCAFQPADIYLLFTTVKTAQLHRLSRLNRSARQSRNTPPPFCLFCSVRPSKRNCITRCSSIPSSSPCSSFLLVALSWLLGLTSPYYLFSFHFYSLGKVPDDDDDERQHRRHILLFSVLLFTLLYQGWSHNCGHL